MDMARVWPVICQYGIGALLMALGIWAGLSSGYLDLNRTDDRRLMSILIGGFLLMLAFVCVFTFWAPFVPAGGAS